VLKRMKQSLVSVLKQIIKKASSWAFAGSHNSFIEHQINSIEQTDLFTTFYTRNISPEKQIEQISRMHALVNEYAEQGKEVPAGLGLGIVIQGPVCMEKDFTSRVISRYLDIFPAALIIFSTWTGEEIKLKDLDKFMLNSRFQILLNRKPANPGFSNINLQIETSKNGLILAKELGCEFGIKTRSDQAILNPNSLDLLRFEMTQAKENYKQNERIVTVSLDTFLYRPYGVSDMFHFGRIETLLDYWNIGLDDRNPNESLVITATSLRNYSKLRLAECYLASEYLSKKSLEPNFTLRQSLEFIRDYFIIVDQQAIDLIWNKNTRKEFRYESNVYPSKFQEIQNWEWRAMQSDLDSFLKFEFLLDYPNDF
jgi:hypothetical protein